MFPYVPVCTLLLVGIRDVPQTKHNTTTSGNSYLSYEVVSWSDIMPCIKIDKALHAKYAISKFLYIGPLKQKKVRVKL